MAVGAVLGAVASAIGEAAIQDNSAEKRAEIAMLDADTGVSGGKLGAPGTRRRRRVLF
jgi:hypothetical protein